DDFYTEEDTLKLLECTSVCLQDKNKSWHQQAAHITFVKKRLFGIQLIDHKITMLSTFIIHDCCWTCLWERSVLIPNRWNQPKCMHNRAIFLRSIKQDIHKKQDLVTKQLIDEHNDYVHVPL
ncbi:hypothetical protein CLU79DRAFT_713153, partial [Phycomyces nitens]